MSRGSDFHVVQFKNLFIYGWFFVVVVVFLLRNHALSGVVQWIERWPANRKVAGPMPGWGACLGCRPGPWLGACERQSINVSLTH